VNVSGSGSIGVEEVTLNNSVTLINTEMRGGRSGAVKDKVR
jgi:hypothetical protein